MTELTDFNIKIMDESKTLEIRFAVTIFCDTKLDASETKNKILDNEQIVERLRQRLNEIRKEDKKTTLTVSGMINEFEKLLEDEK